MFASRLFAVGAFAVGAFLLPLITSIKAFAAEPDSLRLPRPGDHELRLLNPTTLELTLITTKAPDPARPQQWDFVDARQRPQLPDRREFLVIAAGATNPVRSVGFKRRVLYAPLKQRDLRILNQLYLQLENPVPDSAPVEVRNPGNKLWPATTRFLAEADPRRWSPAIHVNQVGYLRGHSKKAMVGHYLGSLGEMPLTHTSSGTNTGSGNPGFRLIDAQSGEEVHRGPLTPRGDRGFPFSSGQRVFEADFTAFNQPGEYRLAVEGLGASFPFRISDDIAAVFARTYALGIYHQRCGGANELPFTRFAHGPCHIAPAEVPSMSARFETVNYVLEKETDGAKENRRHTAPVLKNVSASLYPLLNKGPVPVRGGHHDAGDYSKYTANSASFVHLLLFAADNFPGAVRLDNLGLPESGDGRSDLLQLVKWEADFLSNMQDTDGGFYFLVYPRDRRYEDNVTPDKGDPQVVFPKTTSATASAVAALAQCASSPEFRKQFPEAAAQYLEKAKKGWAFLEGAIAKHGKDGAYQKITHYGDMFMHDDELAWAACEMFLATGEPGPHDRLREWFNPANPETRRWSWWRLFDAYGNAIRSYAFGARSGRLKAGQLNTKYLELCEAEIVANGEDQVRWAEESAYGTSFPFETKRTRGAGWYFSGDAAFDLAVAWQLNYPSRNDPRPGILNALLSNLNYEAGCNPVNMTYITGVGWKRQREIVHQYAQNDRRTLPPTGIPLGNLQAGFGWLEKYGKELGDLSFPPDGDNVAPYPIYDRWGDSFNLSTEFVVPNQARALGYLAWLMARTPVAEQPWRSAAGRILGLPDAVQPGVKLPLKLAADGVDLNGAQIVWEAANHEPSLGQAFSFAPTAPGNYWVEAEAQLPDGRRIFAASEVTVRR